MGYDPGGLSLTVQAPGNGARHWEYKDTGGEAVSVYQGAGYFADAKNKGCSPGEPITIVNLGNDVVYRGRFTAVQDTGGTTGTVVLDTGPDIPG